MAATNRVGFRSQVHSMIAPPVSEFQIIDPEMEIWRAHPASEIASRHQAAGRICPRRWIGRSL
jgi:hypothetical protein